MKHKMPSYKTLEKVFKKLNDLDQIQAVLHWDSSVMMPSAGVGARSEQLSTLKSLQHAILTDPGIETLFNKVQEEQKNLSGWQKANLKEMQRVFKHTNAVPRKLLKELTKAGAICEMIWREAKQENNFSKIVKPLQYVIELTREVGIVKSEVLGCSPYDALLDQYDPGRKTQQLDEIFSDLKSFLPGFTAQVVEKQQRDNKTLDIKGNFPIAKQKELSRKLLDLMGFDFKRGRIDESSHPFCGGYNGDIRITTRYDENDFVSSLMAVMHEAGHAMYEAGLPYNWDGQPVGQSRSMSLHESQSLLIEMQVCRSREFLGYILPQVKELFELSGDQWSGDNLYNACTKVQPSLIRVNADEVTYPSHIILRYYMEKYLLSGDMKVEDLPEAWKQGMEKFVGIVPDNDTNGCLQDIHWMDGTFGYFPTYVLGAVYAAQIFSSAKAANPEIVPSIGNGDFKPIKTWLNEHIHDKASRYDTDELVESATGKKLDLEAYKNYLRSKYLEQ